MVAAAQRSISESEKHHVESQQLLKAELRSTSHRLEETIAKLESALKDSSAQAAIIADIDSKLLASDDLLTTRTARLDSMKREMDGLRAEGEKEKQSLRHQVLVRMLLTNCIDSYPPSIPNHCSVFFRSPLLRTL